MSEFSEKAALIKESMRDHAFSPLMEGEEDIANDDSNIESHEFNEPNDLNEPVENVEVDDKPRKKSNYRTRGDRHKLQARLDQISYEKNLYANQNRELMARLQEQERLIAENQHKASQHEQQRDAYYEDSLATKEQSILNALKVAKEEGDIEREVTLSHELSKIAAEKSTYDLYKNQISPQQQQHYNNQQSYNNYDNNYNIPDIPALDTYNSYQNEPQNEHFEQWLEDNPWADPESHNYSPRLREEVNRIANELDDLLRYDGNAHMIGTPEYFGSIDNLMREKYSINSNRPQQNRNQSRSNNVAPVSRNGGSMADQYMSTNRNNTRQSVPLTQEEYNIARNLQIRLPNGNMASPEEAIRRYREAKMSDRSRDHSGSNRITID